MKLEYAPFDIIAEFNSDFNFHFPDDITPITSEQYDFEFVVAHEITHGLGFNTRWTSWDAFVNGLEGTKWLTPFFNVRRGSVVESWQPVSVFDLYLVESATQTSLMDYVNAIYGFKVSGLTLDGFANGFVKSGNPFMQAEKVYSLADSNQGAIAFKTAVFDGVSSLVILETGIKYSPASSIAHVDYDSYWGTSNFLMIPAASRIQGQDLKSLLEARSSEGSIYGDLLLKIMTTIGYPSILDNSITTIEINPDISAFPAGNVATGHSSVVKVSSLFLLVVLMSSFWLRLMSSL